MPRKLRCQNFDHIRQELARLEKGSVTTSGNWSYYQIITHLTKGIENSMKGARHEIPFVRKHIVGRIAYGAFKLCGRIPRGLPGPAKDRIEGNEAEAVAKYSNALDTFQEFEGPVSDHPVLGPFTKKKWLNFHAWHFANHVSNAEFKDK